MTTTDLEPLLSAGARDEDAGDPEVVFPAVQSGFDETTPFYVRD